MTKIVVKQNTENVVKNIFTRGNIVSLISNPDDLVLVTEQKREGYFEGIALKHSLYAPGEFEDSWICSSFKEFKGTVELTVD